MSSKEAPRPGLLRAARDGKISNREGAKALGLSIRQFRRLRRRFEEGGAEGLLHRSRGRPSPRRLPALLRRKVLCLIQGRYGGFNDCHVTEMLREHEGLHLSRSMVRLLRRELGLPPKHRRPSARHRRRRARQSQSGRLVLVDASQHAWCEDRCPSFALIGALDDATGAVLGLVARPHEDLHGYAVLLHHVIRTHGLPAALYGDRTNIFVRNDGHWTLEEELAGERHPTQGGRMLRDLGIAYIQARSPQAKGRIERFWGTLQDRFVSLLRLHAARSLEETQELIAPFVEDFNRRFARPPLDPQPAWRRPQHDFARHLACHYTRVVAHDNTAALGSRWIQIPSGPRRRSYAGCRVRLIERLDGSLLVQYQGATIASQSSPSGFTLCGHARDQGPRTPKPGAPAAPPKLQAKPKSHPAARNHPWRLEFRLYTRSKERQGEDIFT